MIDLNMTFPALVLTCAVMLAAPSAEAAQSGTAPTAPASAESVIGPTDATGQRHSPHTQITRRNVQDLKPAWQLPLDTTTGLEGAPLVVDDRMYVYMPGNARVQAIDLRTRKIAWQHDARQDPSSGDRMCCGLVSRGLAYDEGRIFVQQPDSVLVALDARSGRELWRVRNDDAQAGATATNAPHVFDGKVVTGVAGGEYGVRGHVSAYEAATGKLLWRGFSTGPDPDMLVEPQRTRTWHDGRMQPVGSDSSLRSWQAEQWRQGGGSTWGWYSYDPKLRLLYYGSGNPSTWNPVQRPGDNRWSSSLWARDIDSGEVRWVYQMTPHDEWDYDGVNEAVLYESRTGRPLLAHFDRNGFVYVLDRAKGELISAEPYDPIVNWATRVDARSGRPRVEPKHSPQAQGEDSSVENICPSTLGLKNQAPVSHDPSKQLFFVPTARLCMDFEIFAAEYRKGEPYIGGSYRLRAPPHDPSHLGQLSAWDTARKHAKWKRPEALPLWGGVLSTATGLVFYGTLDGHLKALDSRDGRLLWQSPQLPSGVVGNVISWMLDGQQYVGVYSGVGGLAADPDGIARIAKVHGAEAGTPEAQTRTPSGTKAARRTAPSGSFQVFSLGR